MPKESQEVHNHCLSLAWTQCLYANQKIFISTLNYFMAHTSDEILQTIEQRIKERLH